MNAWLLLAIAIIFEVIGTSLLKMSDGFARWGIGMGSIFCYWICFAFLALAIKTIPVGIAYAVWAGFGITIITLIGWLVFKQGLSTAQIGCIALIAIGAIGLNLMTPVEGEAAHRVGTGASPE